MGPGWGRVARGVGVSIASAEEKTDPTPTIPKANSNMAIYHKYKKSVRSLNEGDVFWSGLHYRSSKLDI